MNYINKVLRDHKRQIIHLAEKWRWMGVIIVGLSLAGAQFYEFTEQKFLNKSFHLLELVIYGSFLISTSLFIELFARSNRGNEKLLKILEYKHNLSLELFLNDDPETLITKLVQLPGKITDVGETYLLIHAPLNGHVEIAGHWDSEVQDENEEWDPMIPCPKCLEKQLHAYNFHMCREGSDLFPAIYSLSIVSAYYPTTVIRFKMRSGVQLMHEEEKIFKNIGDEIAVALRASRDRKKLLEMQAAEVAMTERRMIFGYVHDQLGQNLGYLQLKLDQLGANKNIAHMESIRKDLNQLRNVANQSYDIVRDILKKMQAESTPDLSNLLREHALIFSERAKFALDFTSVGQPVLLLPEIQQIIFFAFGEILSNIEKHSKANKVDVLMEWSEDFLDLSVADNGIGFEIGSIRKDEHFGLEIMTERISYFNGKLMIDSDINTGTVISITIPTKPTKRIIL